MTKPVRRPARAVDLDDIISNQILGTDGNVLALVAQGLLQPSDKSAFDRFNDVRNDFAHRFGHRFNLADALSLARELEGQGIDFSDSAGHYSETQAEAYYDGLEGILAETGWCLLAHAGFQLKQAGGRNMFTGAADIRPAATP